jgi:hypothetical protein
MRVMGSLYTDSGGVKMIDDQAFRSRKSESLSKVKAMLRIFLNSNLFFSSPDIPIESPSNI